MTIQFNGDNNVTVHQGFRDKLQDALKLELNRFSENITRVDVYLSDENSNKPGPDDKKCLLEARVEGRPPVVAEATANNYELAVDAALGRLKSSLYRIFERMKDH